MGALEHRPCADGEIKLAGIAAVEAAFACCNALRALAAGAYGTIGPEALLKVGDGARLIWKPVE
jgi:hypothetical protein